MGKKQEGAPPPHPHTVIMWVVGVLLTTSVALCGLFFKASAQTTVPTSPTAKIASVPGNQNNVTVQAPPRERKQLGGGFGCANSRE